MSASRLLSKRVIRLIRLKNLMSDSRLTNPLDLARACSQTSNAVLGKRKGEPKLALD